ncbi:hypothetical protein ACF0H5_016876 [Mactra antiquata]
MDACSDSETVFRGLDDNDGSMGINNSHDDSLDLLTCGQRSLQNSVVRNETTQSSDDENVFQYTEVDDEDVLKEYRSIVQLYRTVPRDKCVSQIVKQFDSSDSELEKVRDFYFESLKMTYEDFPFGENFCLKRRMFTRSGDPLSWRLAQDIYHIVSVTEGLKTHDQYWAKV